MIVISSFVIGLLCPEVQAGLFDVNLWLDVYGTRDDNILLMSDEELESSSIDPIDEILQVRPQIKVNYHGTRSSMRFSYEVFKEWYNRYHPLDRTPTSYTDGSILFGYELTERLTLGLFDNYKDSLYSATRSEIPDVRDDYTQNILEPTIKYTDIGDRLSIALAGRWSYIDYEEDPLHIHAMDYGFADWDEYGGRLNIGIALQTRTRFLINAGLWERSYDEEAVAWNSDHSGYSVSAGISQELGEGVTFQVMGDFCHRDYDSEQSEGDNAYDAFGGSVSLSNQFSGITRLELEAFSNFDQSERVSSAFFRNTGAKGVFYTQLSERIEASFLCSFSRLTYDNIDNAWDDDYFQAGVKLGYVVTEWLSIRGQYMFSRRDSGGDFGDYDNNLVSIYFQFRHNFLY